MASRKRQDLALVHPEAPQPKVTISGLIAKLLAHGPAREDRDVFIYVDSHIDWSAIATVEELIYQAKWALMEKALHRTITMTVTTQDGQLKKKQVRIYLKPTEHDADGNAAKGWKRADNCTEMQLKECGAIYVKQTIDLAEASNAYGIYAGRIVKNRRALQQSAQAALPPGPMGRKQPKKIMTPPGQTFFTEIMEVATVNPDTGERYLRVKAEEIKIDDIIL